MMEQIPYCQRRGGFEPQVSILDLLFNCGSEPRHYMKPRKSIMKLSVATPQSVRHITEFHQRTTQVAKR
jgi:hypothetical protein